MSWSKIPLALRIAALATLALAALVGVLQPVVVAYGSKVWLVRSGLAYAAKGFAIYGTLELAALLRARAAIGAKLAAAAWAATIALGFVQVGISIADAWTESIALTLHWIWWVALFAVGVGLVIAAARRPLFAALGGVIWLVTQYPPVFDDWVRKQLAGHPDVQLAVSIAQIALQGVVVLWLAAVAVGDVPAGFAVRDPQRIRWGHTKIANALWLRVIAVSALPLVTLVIMGSHDSSSFKAIGGAMIAGAAVSALSFLGFGLGALDATRANQPELQRWPFYVAAGASLWCAGVMIYQLPELYQTMFGSHSGFLAERSSEIASAFEIVLPIVSASAIVTWTTGVAGLAVRRDRLDLAERAHRTAVWFVVLTAGGLAVTHWLLPEARSDGSVLLLLVLALACGLAAIIGAARLARDTAELGNVEQATIPTATIL